MKSATGGCKGRRPRETCSVRTRDGTMTLHFGYATIVSSESVATWPVAEPKTMTLWLCAHCTAVAPLMAARDTEIQQSFDGSVSRYTRALFVPAAMTRRMVFEDESGRASDAKTTPASLYPASTTAPLGGAKVRRSCPLPKFQHCSVPWSRFATISRRSSKSRHMPATPPGTGNVSCSALTGATVHTATLPGLPVIICPNDAEYTKK
eukprot:gene22983-biopygen23331